MLDLIDKEIERLEIEKEPFSYRAEELAIKKLEEEMQPLIERQLKKRPLYEEYTNKITELKNTKKTLETLVNKERRVNVYE
ncbi:hypothetical protein ERUR111494_02605 [Erysipelothrix urinaevulpis]|uniref:hypothetical protein n=1 Tax=Erysipelothrix urinaevulpis TaxID=2683717 RepID=UPI001356E512|nr:hypothetical protein [Erysipelothrix urinaevulpis]